MRAETFFLVAGLTLGCSDTGLNAINDGNGEPDAAIEVTPDYIDFGMISSDVTTVARTFTITSVGTDALDVESITIGGEDASNFLIRTTDTSFSLEPEESLDIEVLFAPTGSDLHFAEANIASNARGNAIVPVGLEGSPSVPDLAIDPDPLEFGNRYIGCEHVSEATLTNVGAETLIIDSLEWSGNAETMGILPRDFELPVTLEPGESRMLSFWFNPDDADVFRGQLVATTNEPDGQTTHNQRGEGIYAGSYTDLFEMPLDPPADIMFAVDQSCSMNDDASRLASNFSTFINQLDSYTSDWQVMVANDDDGCTNSGVLTSAVSGYQSTFATAVQSGGGSLTEKLLSVAANAIERAAVGSCNNGFLRSEAMLHIILVSDEPEQSSSSWSDLVTRIQNAKASSGGTAGNVRVSGIVDLSGCESGANGYTNAASATGGVQLDLCGDWASAANLALLAETSVAQDSFELSRLPVPNTIEVTHNGSLRSESDWTYDSAQNAVVFATGIPEGGDTVEIDYFGAASCD